MKSTFWRLVHRLPWRVTRLICDLCREFPKDPRTPLDPDRVGLTWPRSVVWSCPHYSITGGVLIGSPACSFGCDMSPIPLTRTNR
jgi:hypothetical protein